MKVEICATREAGHMLNHPSTQLLKKALCHTKLSGVYTLSTLHNGHASAPKKVVGLTLGAACREGVILFYPNGSEPPKGYALLVEKKGSAPIINTHELHRKLSAALKEIDDDGHSEMTETGVSVLSSTAEPKQSSAPRSLSPVSHSSRFGPKRENAEARIIPLFENNARIDALHAALFARAATGRRRDAKELEKRDVNIIIREHLGISATQDLAVALCQLVKREIVFPTWKKGKAKSSSKEPCVIAPPKRLVTTPAPSEQPATTSTTQAEAVKAEEVKPVPDLRTQIVNLMERKKELLPFYEEYLRIQVELLDIKRTVASLEIG